MIAKFYRLHRTIRRNAGAEVLAIENAFSRETAFNEKQFYDSGIAVAQTCWPPLMWISEPVT